MATVFLDIEHYNNAEATNEGGTHSMYTSGFVQHGWANRLIPAQKKPGHGAAGA